MEVKEYTLEMRGMPRRDLLEYFVSIGGKSDERGTLIGPNWQVDLSDTWLCQLGSIQVPATRVTFKVMEKDWTGILKAFRLRFLSAGG
ncbi:hypothetical protein [Desulfosporosinus meridiei]|uniref:Molybdopterin cofactor biosynthesis MoaD-related C-terminal domain-containing protein n=1 Tax=Desulfosporosinus meridiei (strain ATCC BAA-275 / DSM 13257 / KCTC 12902 / NCIMB 13706 / S10) TaxID=768704 RepID=J7IUA1_DESMD|nr:hypothetical protein [Desulfosporosinus meridiei]AFQ42266.1 hypothetical protein Desmer_0202 [Desulfosporosinus meridiei DSM 13257]